MNILKTEDQEIEMDEYEMDFEEDECSCDEHDVVSSPTVVLKNGQRIPQEINAYSEEQGSVEKELHEEYDDQIESIEWTEFCSNCLQLK